MIYRTEAMVFTAARLCRFIGPVYWKATPVFPLSIGIGVHRMYVGSGFCLCACACVCMRACVQQKKSIPAMDILHPISHEAAKTMGCVRMHTCVRACVHRCTWVCVCVGGCAHAWVPPPPPVLAKHDQGQNNNGHTGSSCLDKPVLARNAQHKKTLHIEKLPVPHTKDNSHKHGTKTRCAGKIMHGSCVCPSTSGE